MGIATLHPSYEFAVAAFSNIGHHDCAAICVPLVQ